MREPLFGLLFDPNTHELLAVGPMVVESVGSNASDFVIQVVHKGNDVEFISGLTSLLYIPTTCPSIN